MSNLIRLLGRRIVALPIMILGATLLVFVVMAFSTADPARLALGESASLEALEKYREANGLNAPLLVRWVSYLGHLLQGNLGQTFTGVPISQMVGKAFPITLQLTFLGVGLAVIIASILGVIAALYRDQWPDQVIRVISILSLATPSFWLAMLLIQWLGNIPGGAGLFPAVITDWVRFSDDPAGYVRQVFLPVIGIAIPTSGTLTRVVRTSMVEELDKDYVRTAIGAGISKPVVIGRNVFRNALITPITVLGLRFAYALGGAVVIEVIFNIQGMGQLIFQGITRNDINIVTGVTITIAIAFIIVNILVDLLYVLVNPRIRSV